ncbi:hypothetical protein MSBRW_0672 [Methanosarcina barkeri str. Wiesmoor]|uniref:DUF2892 domain-containing protein n=2 Tax=Methanosarcina barkeri TaxID=2208 RepID=A0A0E3QIY8_METBA|nr:hypothetical protein [Methanosarcina barkeri]AKB49925.1 hypothetical protein MSBRW_0672 [Methanosarcina barkeri str. Wiesmoor]
MEVSNYSELIRGDRVRANTPPEINQAIDTEIAAMVRFYASKTDYEIGKRIEELDKEWDIGRIIEIRASTVSLIGIILGLKRSKIWLILPTIASTCLLQYAVQGWCPPVSILRRFGFRTRQEIDLEKYALKALRGDFDEMSYKESNISHAKEAITESRSV